VTPRFAKIFDDLSRHPLALIFFGHVAQAIAPSLWDIPKPPVKAQSDHPTLRKSFSANKLRFAILLKMD
jgi:hypothetical protein